MSVFVGTDEQLKNALGELEARGGTAGAIAGAAAGLIQSLLAERDAAYAAGFEACREMAVAAAEEYEMSAPTYDIQRAANATASLIASDIRAIQPQKKDARPAPAVEVKPKYDQRDMIADIMAEYEPERRGTSMQTQLVDSILSALPPQPPVTKEQAARVLLADPEVVQNLATGGLDGGTYGISQVLEHIAGGGHE